MKIKFDSDLNPIQPLVVLATKSGEMIGGLEVEEFEVTSSFVDPDEISFVVEKEKDGIVNPYWDRIVEFKSIYIPEWDTWFQISVETHEENREHIYKSVTGVGLCEAELGQIMIFNTEINTEDDIARDDYDVNYPTIFYRSDHTEASLLHRLLKDKAPHYTIGHIDESLVNIQRTFEFDEDSIYDALQSIAEEVMCAFIFDNGSVDGKPSRRINAYDIATTCKDCGHRGEFAGVCPKCGSSNLQEGYGEDTLVFVTADEIADTLDFSTDGDSVKNCIRLETGDDLMDDVVTFCSPSGSRYRWMFSDETLEDMPEEFITRLNEYQTTYQKYETGTVYKIPELSTYNNLINKYARGSQEFKAHNTQVSKFADVVGAYYDVSDFITYLRVEMLPDASMEETTAQEQAALLTLDNMSPVSVSDIKAVYQNTAYNAVFSMAKAIISPLYKIEVVDSRFDKANLTWSGEIQLTSYADDEDTATATIENIQIVEDEVGNITQKIFKALAKSNSKDMSVTGLFKLEETEFATEIAKYGLEHLKRFRAAAESCETVLTSAVAADQSQEKKIITETRNKYVRYLEIIDSAINSLQADIDSLDVVIDEIQKNIDDVHKHLDFKTFLGDDLWQILCIYRREDVYSNDNFSSEGLSNEELIKNALSFLELADQELYKSAQYQHTISGDLKNVFAIERFRPLANSFQVGNWIRVRIDETIYRLRLLSFTIGFDDFGSCSVEFSDVSKIKNGISDVKNILSQASSMATSFASVARQADKGQTAKETINDWFDSGLDATNVNIVSGADAQTIVWNQNGMLVRSYDDITELYSPEQMKIVNSTIAITDDGWKTIKTALGRYLYMDPDTSELVTTYGILADTIVGRLLIGKQLKISNDAGSLTFDEDGLTVKNDTNTVVINPNNSSVFSLLKNDDGAQVISLDENGNGIFNGGVYAGANKEISLNPDGTFKIGGNDSAISFDGTNVIIGGVTEVSENKVVINGHGIKPNSIEADAIVSHSLTADQIDVNNLFAQDITATGTITGANLNGGTITGSNLHGGRLILATSGSNRQPATSFDLKKNVSWATYSFLSISDSLGLNLETQGGKRPEGLKLFFKGEAASDSQASATPLVTHSVNSIEVSTMVCPYVSIDADNILMGNMYVSTEDKTETVGTETCSVSKGDSFLEQQIVFNPSTGAASLSGNVIVGDAEDDTGDLHVYGEINSLRTMQSGIQDFKTNSNNEEKPISAGGSRTKLITFDKPFKHPPAVAATIYSGSTSQNYASLQVFVSEVKEDSFKITIINGSSANVSPYGVSWIATINTHGKPEKKAQAVG